MKKTLLFCLFFVLFFGTGQTGFQAQFIDQAADGSYLYYAHGICGVSIGETPALPVDVYVNEVLKLKNINFGKIKGTKKVSLGKASIAIFRTGEGPNSGASALGKIKIEFKPYENVTIAAYLDDKQKVVVQKFTNDLSPVSRSEKCRVIVHNISPGPVGVSFLNSGYGSDGRPYILSDLLETGDKYAFEVAKTILTGVYKGWKLNWKMEIIAGRENALTLYDESFIIKPGKAILVYLYGSLANDNFGVLKKLTKLQK